MDKEAQHPAQNGDGPQPFTPDGKIDPCFADKVSLDRQTWLKIWSEDRTFKATSHRRFVGRALVLVRKLSQPLLKFLLADLYQRQRLFNLAVVYSFEETLRNFVPDYVADNLAKTRDEIEIRLNEIVAQLKKTAADIMNRDDAVFNILDQKSDWLEESLKRLEAQVLRRDAIVASQLAEKGPRASQTARPVSRRSLNERLSYLRFEDAHRGSEADIKTRQSVYVAHFKDVGKVLDVGCGRGEFLEALRSQGIESYGVDHSAEMVHLSREKGLTVVYGDFLEHLASIADGSLGGLFAAQLVEHLDLESIVEFIHLAHQKLSSGGRILLETQNPEALAVGASSFYRDPTHVRPIHPDGLVFLLHSCGFDQIEVSRMSYSKERERLVGPRTLAGRDATEKALAEDVDRLVADLNELLFGSQDFAVLARR